MDNNICIISRKIIVMETSFMGSDKTVSFRDDLYFVLVV